MHMCQDKEGEIKFAFPELFKDLAGYRDFDKRVLWKPETDRFGEKYYGYNNYKSKKQPCPVLSQETVLSHIHTNIHIHTHAHIHM